MNENNVRWTNEKCEECRGWILHDLSQGVRYCEKCGLVVYESELEGVDYI